MERYEAYKDSGIEWIGEIPASWLVQRFRWTLERVNRSPLEGDEIITCFRDGEVTLRSNRREDGFTMSDKEIGYQHICAGDFVIHGMDGFAGAMGISDSDGKASPVLMAFRPIGSHDLRYINYLLRLYAWRNVFLSLSTSIRVRSCDLNWAKVAPLPMVLPSYKEQQAIANYLDEKTAEIDSLVADCEREVEFLQEYRKAIVSEAVTKGLDPDVQMKDSGIEWIGEIPSEWDFVRLKALCIIETGDSDTQDAEPDGAYPFYVRSPIIERSNHFTFDGEGILMAGDGAGAGRVFHHAFGRYAVHQRVYRMGSIQGIDPRLLYYYLSSQFPIVMDQGSAQSTVPSVRKPMLDNLRVCIPPKTLQHSIVSFLDTKTAEIDSLIDAKQQMADKLREYRKSLISEAVTGKFKVPDSSTLRTRR